MIKRGYRIQCQICDRFHDSREPCNSSTASSAADQHRRRVLEALQKYETKRKGVTGLWRD